MENPWILNRQSDGSPVPKKNILEDNLNHFVLEAEKGTQVKALFEDFESWLKDQGVTEKMPYSTLMRKISKARKNLKNNPIPEPEILEAPVKKTFSEKVHLTAKKVVQKIKPGPAPEHWNTHKPKPKKKEVIKVQDHQLPEWARGMPFKNWEKLFILQMSDSSISDKDLINAMQGHGESRYISTVWLKNNFTLQENFKWRLRDYRAYAKIDSERSPDWRSPIDGKKAEDCYEDYLGFLGIPKEVTWSGV